VKSRNQKAESRNQKSWRGAFLLSASCFLLLLCAILRGPLLGWAKKELVMMDNMHDKTQRVNLAGAACWSRVVTNPIGLRTARVN
jgi:hypothetical protein